MSLTVAVQMDPLETIGIAGDSTFALMLKAQERGHRLFHYLAEDLSYEDGRVRARARPVTVQRVAGDHFSAGEFADARPRRRRRRRADAAGPAVRHRLHHRHLSARADRQRDAGRQRPARGPRRARKVVRARFRALHAADDDHAARSTNLRAFHARHGEIVLKPLHGKAGEGGVPDRPRRHQPRRAGRTVRRDLDASRSSPRPSFPPWPRATSASCWSTAKSPARSTAGPAQANSAPTSPPAAPPKPTELTDREREICAAIGPGAQAPRPAVRRHRRDRRAC